MYYVDRLTAMRQDRDISQKEIARILNCQQSAISKYEMRYTPYQGLTQVTNCFRLKFADVNLKKFAIHRWNMTNQTAFADIISIFFINLKKLTLNPFRI